MATKRKPKAKKSQAQKLLDLSHKKNVELMRIISYLRCKDVGIDLDSDLFDSKDRKETKRIIKNLSKSELERYKAIAGVGKYRRKSDPNAPKRCPTCGQYPPAPTQFPSRTDTWTPQPSLADIVKDYEQRNAYANDFR